MGLKEVSPLEFIMVEAGNQLEGISAILSSQGVEFLWRDGKKIPLSGDFGKKICLFFSASWSIPCKSFTQKLIHLYSKLMKMGQPVEIIFVSLDRDEEGFTESLKTMPWLSVPFDEKVNKRISEYYHINQIPSFMPLDADGMATEGDAVGMIEEYGVDSFPFSEKRREELKAIDESKRQGGKLEELLALGGRNYLISGHSKQEVAVRELVGKTIGLYFAANWSPPCRAFATQLTEAYNEILTSFEIVFVSTDRDSEEFDLHTCKMPWLAVPYEEEKTRQDLCRIFDVTRIPTLVFFRPDGKTVTTDGRRMVSLYGAKAFPFTESRIEELEQGLRNQGDGLPCRLKVWNHEHVLKRDLAKAYVCDCCGKHGRFWAYSCELCDYDLHPTCVEEVKN